MSVTQAAAVLSRTREKARSEPSLVAERVLALTPRDPKRALALARRGLARPGPFDPVDRGRLERALGHALRAVGQYVEARAAYLRARRSFTRAGLEIEHAICALGLIDACKYLGRMTEALGAAADARAIFTRHRDWPRLAKLETNIGNLYHQVDALEPALRHYDRAVRLMRRGVPAVDRARIDYNRANILTSLGRRKEAEDLYVGARKEFAASGQRVPAAQVAYGIACLRFLTGDYAAATTELEAVRPELAKLGARPLLALADLDLAEVLLTLRLYPEALILARSAARWFAAHDMRLEEAKCQLFMGNALGCLGRPGDAERALALANRGFRACRHVSGWAAVALARSQVALKEGNPTYAASLALRAYKRFRAAGFRNRALSAGALAAQALGLAGQPREAGRLARYLLTEPRVAGDAPSRVRLLRTAGASQAAEGNTAAALRDYRGALSELNRVQSMLFVDEWRVGFLAEEPAILDELLGLLLSRRPYTRPREIWRSIALASSPKNNPVAPSPGLGTPGPAARQAVEKLRAELEACYARLWRLQRTSSRSIAGSSVRLLERSALRLEGRLRRLAAPSTRARNMARAISSDLPKTKPGETRIVYFSAAGRLGALVLTSDSATLKTDLIANEEIERRIVLLHFQMEGRSQGSPVLEGYARVLEDRVLRHLSALGQALLDPVLSVSAPPNRVRIVPCGNLFRIPFHALPWRDLPLGASAQVMIEPSILFGANGRGTAVDERKRSGAWVIGYSGAEGMAVDYEVRSVADSLSRAVPVELRTGDAASVHELSKAAARASLIHLSGHAVYREEHPEFSALRLADGWVTVSDLAALPLQNACVVLSACETGPRGAVAGREMLGLVRGLVRAGASAVIASLWPVDDWATLELMKDLYVAWRGRGTLGEGLRQVQYARAVADQDPYLWGAFCLIGDGGVPWPGSEQPHVDPL